MKEMSLTEFRKHCLEVVDLVASTREPVVITKNGKPFAKVLPAGPAKEIMGCLAGITEIVGDIESPVQPAEHWKALR